MTDWPTTRRHPRTTLEAFGPYTSRTVLETHPTLGWKLREFVAVWRQYRKAHSWAYAASIAYGCAFKGLPF